jgi:hypothetical protein
MKKIASLMISLCFSLGATLAMAQADPAPPKGEQGKGEHGKGDMMKVRDCTKAPADMKERCEARNKVIEACKDKKEGEERRKCVMENRPKKDEKK